jgi:hypothetical protein
VAAFSGFALRAGRIATVACGFAALAIPSTPALGVPLSLSAPSGCTLSLATALVPGDLVEVRGTGYPADSMVRLSMHGDADVALGSAETDGSGAFQASVPVPVVVTASEVDVVADADGTTCSTHAVVIRAGVDAISIDRSPAALWDNTASTAQLTCIALGVGAAGILLTYLVIGRPREQ